LQALVETRLARLGEHDPQEDVVAGALHWIETHLSTRQPLARLADFLGVSTATVHRLFRERLSTSVRQKVAEVRHEAAARMLAAGEMTIKEIAYRLGYRHPHDVTRGFRNHAGALPVRQVQPRTNPKRPRRRAAPDMTVRPAAA
jgi:AraC-like DNA-binding protein